jgi:hypothetical protein
MAVAAAAAAAAACSGCPGCKLMIERCRIYSSSARLDSCSSSDSRCLSGAGNSSNCQCNSCSGEKRKAAGTEEAKQQVKVSETMAPACWCLLQLAGNITAPDQ